MKPVMCYDCGHCVAQKHSPLHYCFGWGGEPFVIHIPGDQVNCVRFKKKERDDDDE
jgi:hypothetical protein